MNKIIDAVLAKPAAVFMLLFMIFILGMQSFRSMPLESAPDVKIPVIYVSVRLEGASPRDGERLILRPLEKKLASIEGVKEMKSHAVEGFGNVILEFRAGVNSEKALRDVRDKVDQAKPDLPQDADEPTVTEVTFSLFPVLNVILTGNVDERTLITSAKALKDQIENRIESKKKLFINDYFFLFRIYVIIFFYRFYYIEIVLRRKLHGIIQH